MHPDPFPVIPAKAGIHEHRRARVGGRLRSWTPAFAGVTKHLRLAAMALLCLVATPASAERIKDLGNFAGIRTNQLVGYGIVVGLNGTGDDNLEYTIQSMKSRPEEHTSELQSLMRIPYACFCFTKKKNYTTHPQ